VLGRIKAAWQWEQQVSYHEETKDLQEPSGRTVTALLGLQHEDDVIKERM
jgi:hypothetical protein